MTNVISAVVSDQHALIFQAWRCVLGSDRHAVYVSGPITTGLRFVAMREHDPAQGNEMSVMQANIADIIEAAWLLRRETGRTVIEPASLSVQNWSQSDYLELWTSLIERHIVEVRFLDGWQASIGCVLEYERALGHGIGRLRLDGTPITHVEAISAIKGSIARMANHSDAKLAHLGSRLVEVLERLPAA